MSGPLRSSAAVDGNVIPVSSRHETGGPVCRPGVCAGPDCDTPLTNPAAAGRPARFCSSACRTRSYRQARRDTTAEPLVAEVDTGSATSRGRPPDRAWMVRIRRGDRWVIVAFGLRRAHAERIAGQITELIGT